MPPARTLRIPAIHSPTVGARVAHSGGRVSCLVCAGPPACTRSPAASRGRGCLRCRKGRTA